MKNAVDVFIALSTLVDYYGLKLPYETMPGLNGQNFTEQEWAEYQWNPPQYHVEHFPKADFKASPKPSWKEIVDAYNVSAYCNSKRELLYELDLIATRRIALLYHPDADRFPDKEWQVRLSGKDTSESDSERKRLITIHNNWEYRIKQATTISELHTYAKQIKRESTWKSV